jgi:predicted HTH domain antitoxin
MVSVTLKLDEPLIEVLLLLDQPVEQSSRELMVLELYRRHAISAGKAASLLGMDRFDFIRYSGNLGIPFIDMTDEEWDAERQRIERL